MAASQIKAVELDFFSTSNCFSSCFLHAPVGDPFYERYMDSLSESDVIQTESPENSVVIFEILPIDNLEGMKEQRNYVLQMLGELWF